MIQFLRDIFLVALSILVPCVSSYATTAPAAGACIYTATNSSSATVLTDLVQAKATCLSNTSMWAGIAISQSEYNSLLNLIGGVVLTQAQFNALEATSTQMINTVNSLNSTITLLNSTVTTLNNHIASDNAAFASINSQLVLNTANISTNATNISALSAQVNGASSVTSNPTGNFQDGMQLGWGVVGGMAAALAVIFLKRALHI